jgi:hypothetical protein
MPPSGRDRRPRGIDDDLEHMQLPRLRQIAARKSSPSAAASNGTSLTITSVSRVLLSNPTPTVRRHRRPSHFCSEMKGSMVPMPNSHCLSFCRCLV